MAAAASGCTVRLFAPTENRIYFVSTPRARVTDASSKRGRQCYGCNMNRWLLVILLSCSALGCKSGSPSSTQPDARPDAGGITAVLEEVGEHGLVFYDVSGPEALVLCFHGSGGSAEGWTTGDKHSMLLELRAIGYSFVCPTSQDQERAQWSSVNTKSNPDVNNIDSLLETLGVDTSRALFLLGHSNGGGFTSRFALLSERTTEVSAIQLSNAAGIAAAMARDEYRFPTMFAYAICDHVVSSVDVLANRDLLISKQPSVDVLDHPLDEVYENGDYEHCHKFVDTSAATADFFSAAAERAGR